MSKLTGIVFFFGGETTPDGALPCDGRALLQADYPSLFAAIGTTWNTTAGAAAPDADSFRIPPQVRNGIGIFPACSNGSATEVSNANKAHNHTASVTTDPNHTHTRAFKHEGIFRTGNTRQPYTTAGTHNHTDYSSYAGSHSHTITVNNSSAGEFRPLAIVANLCIWT